jgi:hypothetical protein
MYGWQSGIPLPGWYRLTLRSKSVRWSRRYMLREMQRPSLLASVLYFFGQSSLILSIRNNSLLLLRRVSVLEISGNRLLWTAAM